MPLNADQNLLRRLAADRRGSTAMIFAISMVGLCGMVGLSLDYSRALKVRSSAQSTLDQAVLAAAITKAAGGDTSAALAEFFNRNWSGQHAADAPVLSLVTNTDDTLKASASVNVEAMFGKVVGVSSFPINVVSEARTGMPVTEVALAVDNTGSMSGTKLTALKDSAKLMIDEVYKKPKADQRVNFGIVPFAEYVNVGTQYRGQSWLSVPNDSTSNQCWMETPVTSKTNCRTLTGAGYNDGVAYTYTYEQCDYTYGPPEQKCGVVETKWYGCVGSRPSPQDQEVVADSARPVPGLMNMSCNSPLQRLTSDRTTLNSKIDEFVAAYETYIPAGLMWGWRVLSPTGPFADGAPVTGANRARKVLVLMTDGENTRSLDAPYHWGNSKSDADTLPSTLCTKVKSASIEIYTVAFEVTDNQTRNMLRNCATAPNYYFDAKSTSDLRDAFAQIAWQLGVVRLSK